MQYIFDELKVCGFLFSIVSKSTADVLKIQSDLKSTFR